MFTYNSFYKELSSTYNVSISLPLRSVWIALILLKTKNWKHCNKIIFKYMNSVVGPNFNENFVKKRGLWVSWTVLGTHWTATECASQKKKKKRPDAGRKTQSKRVLSQIFLDIILSFYDHKTKISQNLNEIKTVTIKLL